MKIILSPHQDDVPLFAAFTAIKERPLVVTLFNSYVQTYNPSLSPEEKIRVNAVNRNLEDSRAIAELGCEVVTSPLRDDDTELTAKSVSAAIIKLLNEMDLPKPWDIWAPAWESGGHHQHNITAQAAPLIGKLKGSYLTYTNAGKSTKGTLVTPEPAWILRKLKALACYESQIEIAALGCWPHFLRSQEEYMEAPK